MISSKDQWDQIIQESSDFDKLLVDTHGARFRSADEIQKLRDLLPPLGTDSRVHLVISATANDRDTIELAKRFSKIGFDDLIFTALDEACQHGHLLNFQNVVNKPFYAFGIGPKIPEDFEFATKDRLVDLLLNMTKDFNFETNISV